MEKLRYFEQKYGIKRIKIDRRDAKRKFGSSEFRARAAQSYLE